MAIRCTGVAKTYRRQSRELLRERIARALRGEHRPRFHALRDVDFEIRRGEGVAIVGPNGAGKSTLLSLIAGLSAPDEGTLSVEGRICPLLQLGAGFHPDLTGAENVAMNAALLGVGRRRLAEIYESIVAFSGINDFIDEPLRTYSGGMVLRLAFAVAIHVEPDVLLVDEVLAVGDAAFQQSCLVKLDAFRRSGRTLVCASHQLSALEDLCDRGLWLDHGRIVRSGPLREVLDDYRGCAAAPG